MSGSRILYFYALLFSFVLFVFFDLYLFHLLFLFFLMLPLVSLLLTLPLCRAVRYKMEIEDDIVPKGVSSISLTAQNASFLPCACVRVRLSRANALGRVDGRYVEAAQETVRFSLGPRSAFMARPALDLAHCGRVDIDILRVSVSDTLGLFSLPVPSKNGRVSAGSVYVLPEPQRRAIQTDEAADLGLDSATYSGEKAGGDPSEIFQLRDYRPGDPRHSVHWKLSSRMDRLIVREFGLPLNPSLHFLLELCMDADAAAAEHLLATALAFSEYLIAREVVHSLSWLGEEGMLHTVSVTGADTLASVLHELLALNAQKRWSTLEHFALGAAPQSETHLVYLIAGTLATPAEGEGAERLLATLSDLHICRRMTLMPERCSLEIAKAFLDLGCEVQLLDGSVPVVEAEQEP